VTPVVEQGACGSFPLFDGSDGPFDGSVTYPSNGCRVHFQVDSAAGGWSLTVDTASSAGTLSAPLTLEGDQPMASGLVNLPEGQYALALSTRSPALLVTPVVAEGECLERPVFLIDAPGDYQATYQSSGCKIIFQIEAATDHWTLTIKPV
jgi:hypothetical protein